MAKALIITEKPSVARDLTVALKGFEARDGQAYWESSDYICTYAVGHILTFLEPEDIDPALKSWRLSSLPIIPQTFHYKPVSGQEKRLNVIRQLAKRRDVDLLINACDAAREGELIFREIIAHLGLRLPVRRLWLQSMTPEAIRQGFKQLRTGQELDGLGAAAECRAQADWLIGMNATRAFSLQMRRYGQVHAPSGGEERSWSVGRVQTPTLSLLVERELQVLQHVSRPYYRVRANFQSPSSVLHDYSGVYFVPSVAKPLSRTQEQSLAERDERDDRIFDHSQALALVELLQNWGGESGSSEASELREESLRHAPYLFSLTALQKHMASRYKWTSRRTLEAAQRCYEQHKVLTYPRTSSSCLPEDYQPEVKRLLTWLGQQGQITDKFAVHAQTLLREGLRNTEKIFNNAGVTDHFAIIPTGVGGKSASLSGDDAKIFDEVVRRFIQAFFPAAVYDKVRRTTILRRAAQEDTLPAVLHFRTGPLETLRVPGWLAVEDQSKGKSATGKPQTTAKNDVVKDLPPLIAEQNKAHGVAVRVKNDAKVDAESTKPPPRINEAGLLSLMEFAGRHVQDEEKAAALAQAAGLGTAATRADIIQNLKTKLYVDDNLRPTAKGIRLVDTLQRLAKQQKQAAGLTSPELTADLELSLAKLEKSARRPEQFRQELDQYVRAVVEAARHLNEDDLFPASEVLGPCPRCRNSVTERMHGYVCRTACGFLLSKDASGRYLDRVHAAMLLNKGETPPLDGFQDAQGKTFQGWLELERQSGEVVLCRLNERGDLSRTSLSQLNAARSSMQSPSQQKSGKQQSRAGASRFAAKASKSTRGKTDKSGSRKSNSVGACPVHADCQVVETAKSYTCEQRLEAFKAGAKEMTGFFVPKQICGRELSLHEVRTLLKDGTTDELSGFTSKAGKTFQAKLLSTPSGSFVFKFAERSS